MDFFVFLLVNAVLFIRPSEIIPGLEQVQIYNYIIITNLLLAAPKIINLFEGRGLAESPATVCVLGVLAFIFISHITKFDLWSARMGAYEFSKVVAYYLLLVSLVNTPGRFLGFIAAVAGMTLVVTLLAVLQYHELINIPALAALADGAYDPLTGERETIMRLRSTGIFNDPNDLSMIIVAALGICTFGLFGAKLGMFRYLLVAPIGFLGYGLALTQSRGGLLALLAGAMILLTARFGWKKAALAGALIIPCAFALSGRQGDIGGAVSGGTGRARAELWSEGLQLFKESPVFGIGHIQYAEEVGQVAHNSYVHCFVELGFFGGCMFLGLFLVVLASLYRLRAVQPEMAFPALANLQPYLMALVLAYMVSMLSLSRSYVAPTYLIAGLGVAYDRVARLGTSLAPIEISGKLWQRLAVAGVLFIVATYLYIRFFVRFV